MQTTELIFVSISGLMVDVMWLIVIAYLKKASEISSEDEFETLHYLLQYFHA